MQKQPRCRKTAAALCLELGEEDGNDPRYLISKNTARKQSRKALQLCKEAQGIVSLALPGETRHSLLKDLQVVSIQPEQNAQSLCVSLGLYTGDSLALKSRRRRPPNRSMGKSEPRWRGRRTENARRC